MRHSKNKFLLNRFTSWRYATLISLARSVLLYQSVKTTKTKARAVQPLIEKLITLARCNSLAAKRQAYKVLGDHKLVKMLFNDIGPRFANRQCGYTRILNLGSRRGDNAELAILELTEIKKKEIKKQKKPKEETPKEETKQPQAVQEEVQPLEKQPKGKVMVQEEKPQIIKKPPKKFLGGIRNIFKKERDSL